MATSKGVVVKVGEESYLTSYACGETIDALLGRVGQTLGVTKSARLFVLPVHEEDQPSALPKNPDVLINIAKELNSEIPWVSSLFVEVDSMILHLRPSIKSLMARKVVLEYIKTNLSKCLGARVFCIGSSMNNIFLPNETIEVTPFLCKGQEDKWFLRVNEGLCANVMANGGDDDNIHVRSITFNCESASILVDINRLSVNVCHNELVSLYGGALLEDLCHSFGRKSMIKKSLLLIKSWCCYDSAQYSAVGKSLFPDLISAKVLHIMILHIFCRYGALITHPLVALSTFLFYYSKIDLKSVIINIESALSTNMENLSDADLFSSSSPFNDLGDENSDELQQVKSLITNYRLRYQSTIWASTRAKEDDPMEPPADPRDSSITERDSEDRTLDPIPMTNTLPSRGPVAWGISSACPSLTNEFQPPVGLSFESDIWGDPSPSEPNKKKKNSDPAFRVSFMNISDSIRPLVNLTEGITAADVAHITSILSCGYLRLATVLQRCRDCYDGGNETIDLGMGIKSDLVSYFISESMGMSRDVAKVQKSSAFSPDDAANIDELKSSKYFCESEGPESVMRHAELIMGSKITADAVAHLIAHIVEQAGPHPIGEIGKLLQEATGNPNLSRVLKSQFRGLKKLIEGYPHMLRLGGDHSFNPHVYLAEKSNCCQSETCVDALMDAMTDRDSEDPLSPPGSFSLKKQTPPNGRGSGTPTDFGNPVAYSQQYQHYRPEMSTLPKHRSVPTPSNSWQPHDPQRNLYGPPLTNPRTNFPGGARLHPEAGEFEPGRGVDYGINPKQRLDVYRPQQSANAAPLSQTYGYRPKPQQYEQSYYSPAPAPRSQNLQSYPPATKVPQQATRSNGSSRYDLQADIPYGDLTRANYGISNRMNYSNGPLYSTAGRESWDRTSLSQYDPELSQTQISFGGANTSSSARSGSRSFPYNNYEVDSSRSRPTSLSGRADSSDLGLEFDTDRQSFLFPNDFDPGSQSYSITDYDLLRDAAFANTNQSLSHSSYGEGNGNGNGNGIGLLSNRVRYGDRDREMHQEELGGYGDSKLLSYFLRDSER